VETYHSGWIKSIGLIAFIDGDDGEENGELQRFLMFQDSAQC